MINKILLIKFETDINSCEYKNEKGFFCQCDYNLKTNMPKYYKDRTNKKRKYEYNKK